MDKDNKEFDQKSEDKEPKNEDDPQEDEEKFTESDMLQSIKFDVGVESPKNAVSMKKLIDNQQHKITLKNAKKLNMRINRKRKRGPEPSNSAIYYYRMDVLEEVSDLYPNASPSEIVDAVQTKWNKLDNKEKEKYFRLAQIDQKRFDEEAKQYIPKSEGGTMKRPKRKKHPKAPKHPMSAYLYFVSEHRAQVKEKNPEKNFTEIAKMLGQIWKDIDPEKKKQYELKAEEDKQRYRKEKMVFEPCSMIIENKKRKKHPLAPKHPLSGYLYFVANNRADFNKKFPDKDFTEVAKLLGEHWKNLDQKEKRKYQILAAADKKRYEEEKTKWQPPVDRESNYYSMPKKPVTAYSFWAYNQRALILQNSPFINKKELTRLLREKWGKTSDSEKEIYHEKAELDRQRYNRELSVLPRQYRPNYAASRIQRKERLLGVDNDVLMWTSSDVLKFLQTFGVNYEIAKNLTSSGMNGSEFVQLSKSKLRANYGVMSHSDVRRICKAIWILSL